MISSGCGTVRRLIPAMACLLLASCPIPFAQAAGTPFDGVVSDTSGRLLEQVEIFLFNEPAGGAPVTRQLSDADGRFNLGEPLPGPYRLAAVKEGYRLYLGRVNTLMQNSIQVILQPMPEEGQGGTESLPGNASWSLRLPRRSLLRETEAEVLARRGAIASAASDRFTGLERVLSGEFTQSFEARVLPESDRSRVGAYGRNSSLNMTGFLSENARLEFFGQRRSVDRTVGGLDAETTGELRTGLRYDAGPRDRLDFRTFFGGREPDPAGAVPAALAWGGSARWDRQLDGVSRLALRIGYRDGSAGEAMVALADPVAGRMAVLAGEYETLATPGHRIQVGVEANLSQGAAEVDGADGWNIRLRSEDAWALTPPLTLVYGLEYTQRYGYEEPAMLRPKVGAAWVGSAVALRWVAVGALVPGSGDGAVGYEGGLSIHLPGRLRLVGEVTRDPFADRLPEEGSILPGALVRSYGALAYGGRSVALVRDGDSGRISLTWSNGDISGLLGTAPDLASPVLSWAEGTLRFENLDLDLVFPATGTELTVGVQETDSGGPNSRYSVHVRQDLYRPARGAAFRLAVAVVAHEQTTGRESFSRYSMLNAGVSVVF